MIKLILKGILLYITFIGTALFIMIIDSLLISDIILISLLLVLMCSICYIKISKEDLDKITFRKYFDEED